MPSNQLSKAEAGWAVCQRTGSSAKSAAASQHSGQHPTCDQLKAFVKTDLATTRDLITSAVKQLPGVIMLLNKHTRNRGENKREGRRQTVQISDLASCSVV